MRKSKFGEHHDHRDLESGRDGDGPVKSLSRTRDQQRDLRSVEVQFGGIEAADIRGLPELKAEARRLELADLSLENSAVERWESLISQLTDHTVGLPANFTLSSANKQFTSWQSARFRGVMNWTISEDRFQLLTFLGGFLQIVMEVDTG